jgi:hypothetical protein
MWARVMASRAVCAGGFDHGEEVCGLRAVGQLAAQAHGDYLCT